MRAKFATTLFCLLIAAAGAAAQPDSTPTPSTGTPSQETPGTRTPDAATPGAGTSGTGTSGTGTSGTGTSGTGTSGTGTPGTAPGAETPGAGTPGGGTAGAATPSPGTSGSAPGTATPDPGAPAAAAPPPGTPPPGAPGPGTPSVTVLDNLEVQGILGRDVRSTADENMGRIVDVLVDGTGRARAAIIDFGGFLGVGSRKIAVEWKALHFVPAAEKRYSVVLELTREQVKPAPEYKEGKPVIVLGASGNLEPLP